MYFTSLSILIIMLGAVFVFLEMQKGEKIGCERAVLRLCVMIASAFLAAIVSDWCSGMMQGTAQNLLRGVGLSAALEGIMNEASRLIAMIAEPIAAVMIYIPFFLIINAIALGIVNYIRKDGEEVCNRGSYPSENAPLYQRESARLGKICGIICGLVLTVVLLSPFAGILKIFKQIADLPDEILGDNSVFGSDYDTIEFYSDDLMISAVYCCGGSAVFDLTTTVHGITVNDSLKDELNYLKSSDAIEAISVIRKSNIYDDEIKDIIASSKESAIFETLVWTYCKNVLSDWAFSYPSTGVPNPVGSSDGVFYRLKKNLISSAATVHEKYVIEAFSSVITIMDEIKKAEDATRGSDYYAKLSLVSNEELTSRIQEELNRETLFTHIGLDSCYNAMLASVSEEIYNSLKYDDYERDQLFDDLAEAINSASHLDEESRVNQTATNIAVAFENFGMPLPQGGARVLTDLMLARISSYGYVSDWQITNFFENHNDFYITIN